MGSYRNAVMTGFICRLCSEHKSIVIHVYSKRAKSMDLLDKITLLPITIQKYDRLPKTICESCIENLCRQYELVQQVQRSVKAQMNHRMYHGNGNCPVTCPLYRAPITVMPRSPSPPQDIRGFRMLVDDDDDDDDEDDTDAAENASDCETTENVDGIESSTGS